MKIQHPIETVKLIGRGGSEVWPLVVLDLPHGPGLEERNEKKLVSSVQSVFLLLFTLVGKFSLKHAALMLGVFDLSRRIFSTC